MAFWSGEKIIEQQKHFPKLISPFDKDNIDCNAYTLRMGAEYFVTADSRSLANNTKVLLQPGQPFIIPAGQFAFLLTKEAVEIPAGTMAFISMKATFKFQGLINVSGFHVDPGYHGRLVFSVYNAGSNQVDLTEGLPLFLIWFADLDRDAKAPYLKNKYGASTISNDLLKGMNRKILSLQSLSDDIEDVKRNMAVQKGLFIWAIGMATAFWVTIIGAYFADNLTEGHKAKSSPSVAATPASNPVAILPGPAPAAPPAPAVTPGQTNSGAAH